MKFFERIDRRNSLLENPCVIKIQHNNYLNVVYLIDTNGLIRHFYMKKIFKYTEKFKARTVFENIITLIFTLCTTNWGVFTNISSKETIAN